MNTADRLSRWISEATTADSQNLSSADVKPISIIVPGRNVEVTVKRTLDSVLAQTSDRWEIIFIDDGSTDETAMIVQETVGDLNNVRIVRGPEKGVSAARNLGTELAKHDHVLYLDADDWIAPRFVELMGGALAADPSCAGVRCIWSYETPDGRTQAWDDLDLSDLFAAAAFRCPFAIHACVIERDLVLSLGGFDTDLVVGEDWDLWQRVGRAGAKLDFVEEALAFYHMRPESVMHCDLARSQSDLLIVARRGSESDDRVQRPLPQYRNGLPADPTLDINAETLVGTLAVAIPTGVDFVTLLPLDPPDRTKSITADHIAGAMHESVAFGSCALLDDWVELYRRWEPRMHEMLRVFSGWLGQPDITASVLRELEDLIGTSVDVGGPVVIGRTAIGPIDLDQELRDVAMPDGADRFIAAVSFGATPIGHVRLPIIDGVVPASELASSISTHLAPRLANQARKDLRLARRLFPRFLNVDMLKGSGKLLLDLSWSSRVGSRDTADQFLRWSARRAACSLLSVDLGDSMDQEIPKSSGLIGSEATGSEDHYGESYFDEIFAEPDPWHYSGNYEQTKYQQTLEALGDRRFSRGLELACAEGHFTVELAPRVAELTAADISPTALERARERCAEHDGIDFRVIDLRNDKLPQDLDLIVCSEVLYFLETEPALANVAARFAEALAPGGLLVMAHANLIADDPQLTGFDWEHEFGARRIGEIVGGAPGLRLISTRISELYRIHVFERVTTDTPDFVPQVIEVPYATELDPNISRMVLWGGAVTTREETYATEVGYQLPILMYHRVSPTGVSALETYRVTPEAFEEQLIFLRANGYYGITFEQWKYAQLAQRPLPGRPILLTFDDGYRDFLENAWTLLRDYDFPATVFVVADLVGGVASWDSRFGEPPELMDWDELRYLRRNGIEIGSHTSTHKSLTSLSPVDALAQELKTRETFRRELGEDISVIAYPFGEHDEAVQTAMVRAGYEFGVTTQGWLATVWHNRMALPRVDIAHGDDLATFEAKLGQRGTLNPLRRCLRAARNYHRG